MGQEQLRHNELGVKVRGRVWVCDIELEEVVEKDIDQLLEFFS
jgi:hypothetical protein